MLQHTFGTNLQALEARVSSKSRVADDVAAALASNRVAKEDRCYLV